MKLKAIFSISAIFAVAIGMGMSLEEVKTQEDHIGKSQQSEQLKSPISFLGLTELVDMPTPQSTKRGSNNLKASWTFIKPYPHFFITDRQKPTS